MRGFVLMFAIINGVRAAEPIPPSMVTIEPFPRDLSQQAAFLTKQSNIAVGVKEGSDAKLELPRETSQPFWRALEKIAEAGNSHIALSDHGKTIRLEKGLSKMPSSVDGPFRVVVTGVTAKLDLETNQTYYDVALLIHWEPRFPVVRIDTVPTVTKATDDRGSALTSVAPKTKTPIVDACAFNTSIRIAGLTREAKTIQSLEGQFTVTASPKLLLFTFDDLAKLPAENSESDVKVRLSQFKESNGRLEVQLKMLYPESHPAFESFESWADGNKLTLINADRTKSYSPESFSLSGPGRSVTAEYHFKNLPPGDRSGWRLTYATPAPLTEYAEKFSLKDIPLP